MVLQLRCYTLQGPEILSWEKTSDLIVGLQMNDMKVVCRDSPQQPVSVWQITDGVKPTLSELEKFEDQPEGIDLEVVTDSGEGFF